MKTQEIINILKLRTAHKIDLYFNPRKIDKCVQDMGLSISEISISKNQADEINASLLNIISVKAGDGHTTLEKYLLNDRGKAKIILENLESKERVENNHRLISYAGMGSLSIGTFSLLDDESNDLIENERRIQEEIMEVKTYLLLFKNKGVNYVSIARKDYFDLGSLGSYRNSEHFGFLGHIEQNLTENITLVNPFWIWTS